MRFSVVQEPSGTWAVFDGIFGLPADFAGRTLIGLPRDEAYRLAANANHGVLRWRSALTSQRPCRRHHVDFLCSFLCGY